MEDSREGMNAVKYRTIGYYYEGRSITEIAQLVSKSYVTVKRWIEKFKETKDLIKQRPRSGRPSKLSKRAVASMKNMLKRDPSLSYQQVSDKLKGVKKLSKSTVARYLKNSGTKYLPRREPVLSDKNRQKRLAFALQYSKHPLKNIIFSDEVHFDLNGNKRRFYRFRGDPRRPRIHFNPNIKIHVWGAISYKGKVNLYIIPEEYERNPETRKRTKKQVDGEVYLKLIQEQLVPQANALYGQEVWIFQQDNWGPHKKSFVIDYFLNNNIQLVDHPAQSPDLNPIESIWSMMKKRVYDELAVKGYKKAALIESIQKIWRSLPNTLVRKTVLHLRKVCEEVIKNRGGFLK